MGHWHSVALGEGESSVFFNDMTSGRGTTLHGRPHIEDNLGNINWTRWEQEKQTERRKKLGEQRDGEGSGGVGSGNMNSILNEILKELICY